MSAPNFHFNNEQFNRLFPIRLYFYFRLHGKQVYSKGEFLFSSGNNKFELFDLGDIFYKSDFGKQISNLKNTMRSIALVCLISISLFSYGQKPYKKHYKQMSDSCQIFKHILKAKLIYQKQGNYYHDSAGLFYIYHLNSYPAFERCIMHKDTNEIKKMFGKPSRIVHDQNSYTYCLLPNTDVTCCGKYFMIVFDKKWIAEKIHGGGCIKD